MSYRFMLLRKKCVTSLRKYYSALGVKHEHQLRWKQQIFFGVTDKMYPSVRECVDAFVVNKKTSLPLGRTQSLATSQVESQGSSCCSTSLNRVEIDVNWTKTMC